MRPAERTAAQENRNARCRARAVFFGVNPGKQAACDNCGCSCDPNADGAFQPVPGRSRFVMTEVLRQECAKDFWARALCATKLSKRKQVLRNAVLLPGRRFLFLCLGLK